MIKDNEYGLRFQYIRVAYSALGLPAGNQTCNLANREQCSAWQFSYRPRNREYGQQFNTYVHISSLPPYVCHIYKSLPYIYSDKDSCDFTCEVEVIFFGSENTNFQIFFTN